MAVPVINIWFVAFIYGIIFAFATFLQYTVHSLRTLDKLTSFLKLYKKAIQLVKKGGAGASDGAGAGDGDSDGDGVDTGVDNGDDAPTAKVEEDNLDVTWKKCWDEISNHMLLHRCISFCCWFVLLFIINYGFVYKLFLNGQNDIVGLQSISSCFFVILGITYVMCSNVTFVKVFENTVGYGLIQSFLGGTKINKILIPDSSASKDVSYDFLFSVFRVDNFGQALIDIYNDQYLEADRKYPFIISSKSHGSSDDIEVFLDLWDKVYLKHIIGHSCWIYFATLISTLVVSKYMAKNL